MLRQCYFGSGHNVTELAEFAGHGSFESIRIELLPREPDVQRAWLRQDSLLELPYRDSAGCLQVKPRASVSDCLPVCRDSS